MSDQKTNLLIFSADYDKALAAFIIANGARELDMETTMFFAFWGLLLLRDPEKMTLEDKSLYEQMFTLTTPKDAAHLPLSRMNMAGLGKMMLLDMMEDEDTPGLPAFIKGAQNKGVRFCACQLSLDIMGFKLEEMIPGVEVMDVKAYIKDAASAQLQLLYKNIWLVSSITWVFAPVLCMRRVTTGVKIIKSQSFNVKQFRKMVMGVDVRVPVHKNRPARFINFDNAASTPALKPVYDKLKDYLKWYSGVHRGTGHKSILSSQRFDECHEDIARFVKADPERDTAIIVKNTTEAINKLSYRLNLSPTDVVVSTMMEHHSNDLPWRRAGRIDYAGLDSEGRLDLQDVSRKLRFWYPRVRLLTVCGASNVTGHINNIGHLAALAHEYGARFMLDAAQYAPHQALDMKPHGHPEHIDYLAFSGHKIYAPFGAGVLVGPRDTFLKGAPEYAGGGTVALVGSSQVKWGGVPDRDEAGSPNLIGALALSETLKILDSIGMEKIAAYEEQLTEYALRLLKGVPGLTVYGSLPRVGVVSFNMRDVNHSLLGAILAYEGGIGIRTGCFCAQPYVRHLLGQEEPANLDEYARLPVWEMPGLARISLGAYNTLAEIEKLAELLHRIAARKEYQREYVLDLGGAGYIPRSGFTPVPLHLSLDL